MKNLLSQINELDANIFILTVEKKIHDIFDQRQQSSI